jgi:hypothetical protein
MGMPARPALGATTIGLCLLGYGHIGQKSNVIRPANIFCEAHTMVTLSHDDMLTNRFLRVSCGTLQMRIVVSRDCGHNVNPRTFSTCFSTCLDRKIGTKAELCNTPGSLQLYDLGMRSKQPFGRVRPRGPNQGGRMCSEVVYLQYGNVVSLPAG